MSEKRQTKAMQDRHERILNELLKIPGNEYCADCRSKNPRWASYSLGVFLCVRCAGIHRKMGTHISRIKSLSMDQWTVEQIDSIKNGGGNIKVNNIVNPNPTKYPLPLADDEGHAMEKYIRNKWEKRAFMEKATLGPSLAVVPSGIQQSRPRNVPQRSSSVPAIMSENDGIALSRLREMGFKDDYKNQTVLRQTQGNISAAVEILSRQNPRESQSSLSDDQKLVQLRNMGYTDMAANRDALRRTGGNVDVAVTVLKAAPKGASQQTTGSTLLDVSPAAQNQSTGSPFQPFITQSQQQSFTAQPQQQQFTAQSQQQQFTAQPQQQQFTAQPQQQQFMTQPQQQSFTPQPQQQSLMTQPLQQSFMTQPQQQQSFTPQPQQQSFTAQPQQQQPFSAQPQQQQPFSAQPQQQQPFSAQPQLQYSIPQQQHFTLQQPNQSSPFSISSASDPFGQKSLAAPVQSTSLQTAMYSTNSSFGNTPMTSSNPFSNTSGVQQPLTPSASSPFSNYFAQQPVQHPHSFPQQQFSQSSYF